MRLNVRLLLPAVVLVSLAIKAVAEQPTSEGQQLFETHCSACHSLELPRSQRLDRSTWRWVVDDMVNEFGATWITEEQQRLIIDYLVKHHGPD